MTENLGVILVKREEERKAAVLCVEQQKIKEEQARDAACKAASIEWLIKLRNEIPNDVKCGFHWDEKYHGMTYILGKDIGIGARANPTSYLDDRVIYNEEIWDEFVAWAKDHGLSAYVWEKNHSESRGDFGFSQHDYWFVILRPLEE